MKQQIQKHFVFIVAVIVVAIWGETFVSSKILLNAGMMPADIFVIRFTLAYLFMVALSHKRLWANSLKHELMFVATGISGGSLYFLTENMALKYSDASNVAIFLGMTPLVTALLLACFYKEERLTKRQMLGTLVAFCGLTLVVLNGHFVLHLNPVGDLLAFSASLSWAVYSLIMKPLIVQYDSTFITRKVFAYGLLTILPWVIWVQPFHFDATMFAQPAVWGNLLYLAVVASMGCFLVWNWVLPRLGVVRATNVVYTQCFFTLIISHIVLDERITLMAICGTLILIGGMLLITKKTE